MQQELADFDVVAKSIPSITLISDAKIRSDTAVVFMQLLRESKWPNLEKQQMLPILAISGMEHVNAVVEMCLAIADILKKRHNVVINIDYLISGAILHDASKLVEFEPTNNGERKTKIGDLVQHTVRCVSLMLDRKMPEEIAHVVVSHTPQSRTAPKTIESIILYFIDSIDYSVMRVKLGLGSDIQKT